MRIIIFDTETTGIEEPELIEAAYIGLDENDLRGVKTVGEPFCQRYQPSKPISLGAKATHHILESDLEGCPPSTDFALPDGVMILIGHNIDYDWRVIGEPRVRRICTLAMARRAFPGLDSYSQSALMYHFGTIDEKNVREKLKNAHSALADVRFCHVILWHIIRKVFPIGMPSWKALWEYSEEARIPLEMPFGKHKGMPIAELPKDYREWALSNLADMDQYLRKALEMVA